MSDFTVLHNNRCSTSRSAMDEAASAGVEPTVRQYLKEPLSRAELQDLLGKLEDAPTDLVRRDPKFKELGLTEADVQTSDQVVDVLTEHPELMQRPVIVHGDRAIIGRPKSRVPEFFRE